MNEMRSDAPVSSDMIARTVWVKYFDIETGILTCREYAGGPNGEYTPLEGGRVYQIALTR